MGREFERITMVLYSRLMQYVYGKDPEFNNAGQGESNSSGRRE
jgi:hypothetical protein